MSGCVSHLVEVIPGRWSAGHWFFLAEGQTQAPGQRTVSSGQSHRPKSSCDLLWSRTPPPPAGRRQVTRSSTPTPSVEKQSKNSRAALPGPPRIPGPPDCHLRSRRRRRPALGGLLRRPALPAACWRDSCPESLGVVKENRKYIQTQLIS